MQRIMGGIIAAGLALGMATASLAQSRVGQRQENQQDRIAQGINNGKLSDGEAARLEMKESKLNQEIRTDRQRNGGNLTNNQKAQINRQQNRLSDQIYDAKHDGKNH